jgi:LmbE family N-acetylglucosaminyl deacetylase
MNYAETLFADTTRIGRIQSHRDDEATGGHVEARTIGLPKHLITLTPSNAGTRDFAPKVTDVRNGGRIAEGRASAKMLGYQTDAQLYAPDGNVMRHIDAVVPTVAEWIRHYDINVLMSTRRLTDHADHIAAGIIALRAAQLVAYEDGREIGLLEVHPTYGPHGEWLSEATPESRSVLHRALAKNVSQFRYAQAGEAPSDDHVAVAPGLALHRADMDDLSIYAIETDATYTYYRVGQLAVAQVELVPVAAYS